MNHRVSSLLRTGALLVALLISESWGQDEYYETTVDQLGTTERLYCSNYTTGNAYPNDSIPLAWMLPNLTVLFNSSADQKFTFLDGSWTLEIQSVNVDDLGLYHCMMDTVESQWFLVKLGLNSRGPFFVDGWDTYWLNTVIGISAVAAYLLIVVVLYFLCRVKPQWFDAWNNGGASNKIDPYDDDDKSSISEDLEKKVALRATGSVKSLEKEEKKSVRSDDKVNVDEGKANVAFVNDEDTKM